MEELQKTSIHQRYFSDGTNFMDALKRIIIIIIIIRRRRRRRRKRRRKRKSTPEH
jgi:hypothetical protein